ncbi:hypothetical protein H0H93_000527 [Arthromyces matolae]|nr:hypothetical protein H0H93_000527 [Arthromyces matolae]
MCSLDLYIKPPHLSPVKSKNSDSAYNPCLKLLRLYKVEGISNAGLSSFLSIVAPTLVVLEISHCQFTHYGEEENAVDKVMEKLESLQQLLITGPGIVTALALSRKRTFVSQVQGSTSSGSPGQIRGSKKRCAIVVSSATEEMRMEEMARALETTAWNSVSIHWKRIDLEHQIGAGAQTHSQTHAQAAVQKATEKAITISFTSGEFGISLGSNVNV